METINCLIILLMIILIGFIITLILSDFDINIFNAIGSLF